jgi:hypothetical protein
MLPTSALTATEYLAELPPDRKALVSALRKTIRQHLPKGYREMVNWGMLAYCVPLSRYPKTYNGQPLCYAALSSQKNYVSVHLVGAYMNPAVTRAIEAGFKAAGKKLDMGKGCLRVKRLEDVPLDVVGAAIASMSVEGYISTYESVHKKRKNAGQGQSAA